MIYCNNFTLIFQDIENKRIQSIRSLLVNSILIVRFLSPSKENNSEISRLYTIFDKELAIILHFINLSGYLKRKMALVGIFPEIYKFPI